MTRFMLTLSLATLLTAWVDAQQTGGLLAADRVRLLETNRALVEKLVSRTVEISDENDALKRATTCHKAMTDLMTSLNSAVDKQDASRIAELGEHLADMAENGLAPCFTAGKDYEAGSASALALKTLHDKAVQDLKGLDLSVSRIGTLGQSNQVKQTRDKWQAAMKALK